MTMARPQEKAVVVTAKADPVRMVLLTVLRVVIVEGIRAQNMIGYIYFAIGCKCLNRRLVYLVCLCLASGGKGAALKKIEERGEK